MKIDHLINGKAVGQYTGIIRNAGQVCIYYSSHGSMSNVEVLFTNLRVVPTP